MARTGVWRKRRRNLQQRNHPWMVLCSFCIAMVVVWVVVLRGKVSPSELASMVMRAVSGTDHHDAAIGSVTDVVLANDDDDRCEFADGGGEGQQECGHDGL